MNIEIAEILTKLETASFNELSLTIDELKKLENINWEGLLRLFSITNKIRNDFFGNKIEFCSIINAKSGLCPEDCSFCSQSSVSKATIKKYPLLSVNEVVAKAVEMEKNGVSRFSVVTSGTAISSKQEQKRMLEYIEEIKNKTSLKIDASLGNVSKKFLKEMKDAGLSRVHNNLETAKSFFPNITTTHTQDDKYKTIYSAKEVGLEVCSGGIIGLGESFSQRIELAFQLKELAVDSIPINFLTPIKGTPLEGKNYINSFDGLLTIVLFRLIMPDKHIIIAGGREYLLKELHSLIYFAGASGVMVGNYLTTLGRTPRSDIELIKELSLDLL